MMNGKKRAAILVVLLMASLLIAGCAGTDVVRKYSPSSFAAITESFPAVVAERTATDLYYPLSVDGETKLLISSDYSRSKGDDLVMVTPLQPFLAAGLDPAKLDGGYRTEGEMLLLAADYGDGSGVRENVTDALFDSVEHDRKVLGYHQDLDHYGIQLPGGKFEFAKDYASNDKDIVFVLAAQPLAQIGVDVQNIQGWIFKTMAEADGSKIDVLLKPYDLK